MALVAVAADKGAPGVTTAALALAAVWPRPVLLAECDAAGGDLFYRLPAADGGRLDPQRGLLSLAVAARRGIQPHQVWRHTQKLHGGLDILTGLVNAEQAGGLQTLWGQVGKVLAELPEVDVIADCGRLGADGPFYDMLAHASAVVLIARITLEDVVRLRDRVIAVAQGLANRRLAGVQIGVVIVADRKHFKRHLAEAAQALALSGAPARVLGGLADEPRTAHMLRGRWSTKLDRSLLIRTARELAALIARDLPARPGAAGQEQSPPGWWPVDQRAAQVPGAPPKQDSAPPAQAPPAQVPREQVPAGQAPPAQVPPAQVPGGLTAAAKVPDEDMPAGRAAADQVAAGYTPVPAAPVPAAPVPAAPVPAMPMPATPMPAVPVPAVPVPAVPVPVPVAVEPAAPVWADQQTAGVRVLGVPVVTGPMPQMPFAAAPVPADAVPADAVPADAAQAGVPVLGVPVLTGPMPQVPLVPLPESVAPQHAGQAALAHFAPRPGPAGSALASPVPAIAAPPEPGARADAEPDHHGPNGRHADSWAGG